MSKEIGTASTLKDEGNAHFKKGEFDRAYDLYTKALVAEPLSCVLYCNRSACCLALQRFREAELDCGIAITLDKTSSKAFFRRAQARMHMPGRLELARIDAEEAAKLAPGKATTELLEKIEGLIAEEKKKNSNNNAENGGEPVTLGRQEKSREAARKREDEQKNKKADSVLEKSKSVDDSKSSSEKSKVPDVDSKNVLQETAKSVAIDDSRDVLEKSKTPDPMKDSEMRKTDGANARDESTVVAVDEKIVASEVSESKDISDLQAARRLYVGNLPLSCSLQDLHEVWVALMFRLLAERILFFLFLQFFNEAMKKSGFFGVGGQNPVAGVQLFSEKRFAFLDFDHSQLASECLSLDGIVMHGESLRLRRPTAYQPLARAVEGALVRAANETKKPIVAEFNYKAPKTAFELETNLAHLANNADQLCQYIGLLTPDSLTKVLGIAFSEEMLCVFCRAFEHEMFDPRLAASLLKSMLAAPRCELVIDFLSDETKARFSKLFAKWKAEKGIETSNLKKFCE